MTDVDVEHVKYQLALALEQTPPDVKKALDTLFVQYPADVLSALTDGQVKEAGESGTIEDWVGPSHGDSGATGRRPLPSITGLPTWMPHHPAANEDIVVSWEETNTGAELGAYTDLVEVYLSDDGGEEKLKEIRIDGTKLGGHQSENAPRSVTVSAPRDGSLKVAITVNEDGAEDAGSATAQGMKMTTQVNIAVGGADDKPMHGEHDEGFKFQAAFDSIQQALSSLNVLVTNEEGGELAAQQFGAGLYLASYLSEAFPQFGHEGLEEFRVYTTWLYEEGSKLYGYGHNAWLFDPEGGSFQNTKSVASDMVILYNSLLSSLSTLMDSPDQALSQGTTTIQSIKSVVEGMYSG